MKKITTLFKKNPENLALVINEVNPENIWVINGEGIPTRKFDGTPLALINGYVYKRFDAKRGKAIPIGAIPCQEADHVSGSHPHWVRCNPGNPEDRLFYEGLHNYETANNCVFSALDGTFELIGERINKNSEKIVGHTLVRHGADVLQIESLSFDYLKKYLSDPENDIEGIVWHHKVDGRMCKLRKSDFGIKR